MAEVHQRGGFNLVRVFRQFRRQRQGFACRRAFADNLMVTVEEFLHRRLFPFVRRTRESEAISCVHLLGRVAARRLDDAARETLRPLQSQFAVQQIECLQRRGGDVAARTALVGVRHVKTFKERIARVAPNKHVNAPAVAFRFVLGEFPTAIGRGHARRQFGKNAGASHFQVQQAGDGQRRVTNLFAFEPLTRETPE